MNINNLEKEYEEHLSQIKLHLDYYLEKTCLIGKEFGGPSKYFHTEAIHESRNNFLGERHLDMIYAMLPAWGMHETGDSPVKTIEHTIFLNEIAKNKERLLELRPITITDLKKNTIESIENSVIDLLFNMHISESNAYLVSSSKVLHHIIPGLICPIDRTYSIYLLLGNSQYKNEYEKEYAKIFINKMYQFIIENINTLNKYIDDEFNTSITKIFDNLVIAYKKVLTGKIDFNINVGDNIIDIMQKHRLLPFDELKKKINSMGYSVDEKGKVVQ